MENNRKTFMQEDFSSNLPKSETTIIKLYPVWEFVANFKPGSGTFIDNDALKNGSPI